MGTAPLGKGGAEATPREGEAGPDEDNRGGGGESGDGLAEQASGLAGMYGTNPSTEPTGEGKVLEALRTQQGAGGRIEDPLHF